MPEPSAAPRGTVLDPAYKRVGPFRRLRRATKALRAPSKRLLFPWLVPLSGGIVGWGLRAIIATGRCTWIEAPGAKDLRESRKPFVFVEFHGRQFPLLPYAIAVPMIVLTSMSDLGWFEACFLKVFGAEIERGSTTRGGARALIQLRRRLEEGKVVTISVDAPRGPHEQVKAGAIFLARKTGIPIVPGAASFRPGYRIRGSWDRSFVPIPFARATVVIGEPIHVRQDGGDEVIAQEQARVQRALLELGERADRHERHPGKRPSRT
jgi:lysophospholipid acyltransferase (LPLAT)-like uncharacterized protein